MPHADYYAPGSWNFDCFRCGRTFKAFEGRKNWQGFWTCQKCWEPRQPQDYVRGVPDEMAPPWTQPPSGDVFVHFCTPNGTSAIADSAVADCAIADYVSPLYDPNVTF